MQRRAVLICLVLLALGVLVGGAVQVQAGQASTPTPSVTSSFTPYPMQALVLVERAPVFAMPDRTAEPVTYLFMAEPVSVLGRTENGVFLRIRTVDVEGWVIGTQLALDGSPDELPLFVATPTPTPTPTGSSTPAITPPADPGDELLDSYPDEMVDMFTGDGTLGPGTATPSRAPDPSEALNTPRPTRTPLPTRTPAGDVPSAEPASDLPLTPTQTFTPLPPATDEVASSPTATAETADPAETTVPLPDVDLGNYNLLPGVEPPITMALPENWETLHLLVPFRAVAATAAGEGQLYEVPMSIFFGPLAGEATGFVYLFWGFPNILTVTGEYNFWADGVHILRSVFVDPTCNLGVYDRQTLFVGRRAAVGSFFQAVDCEEEPDTAGWFVVVHLEEEGSTFAFFTAVEPPGALPDQVAFLQAILDSVEFLPAEEQ
ncbi:MAG: hypothetical protein GYB65_16125 [Chloroflexi bacterium]|nr:hypothetical protein [Chloroflexota bacterium]